MKEQVETGATLSFERFWRWLHAHRTCIVRAGASDTYLYDQDDFHWQLDEDPDRSPVVQLCCGKQIIAEVVMDVRDVLFVQVSPSPEGDQNLYLFEVVGGPKGDPYAMYHLLLTHPFEEVELAHRGALKH